MLDPQSTLIAETRKGARTDRKESSIRRRYQQGCCFIRGKVWVARWREDVITPDGKPGRILRWEVLGPVSEIGRNKRDARKLLDVRLRPFNQGRQLPQSTMRLKQFVEEIWKLGVLSMLKPGSVRYYGV